METRLTRIEEKLDKLVEIQADLRADVAEHIRRTEIAEQNIVQISEQVKPIQEHVAIVRGFGKIMMGLAAVAAALVTIWQSLGGKQ